MTAVCWDVPAEPGRTVAVVYDEDGYEWNRRPDDGTPDVPGVDAWVSTERFGEHAMVHQTTWPQLVVDYGTIHAQRPTPPGQDVCDG